MGSVLAWRAALVLQVATVFCLANSPPSLSDKVESRVITSKGTTTRLLCPANADYITWKKDGQSVKSGWDRFKVVRNRDLRIKDTHMSDAGTYTCIATNGFGSIDINYTVIVIDKDNNVFQEGAAIYKLSDDEDLYKEGSVPQFEELERMQESMNLVKPEGSTIRLYCGASGNPRPQVRWLRNGQPLEKRKRHPTLKLHNVQQDNSGTYTCVASNRRGQTNFTYNVQVIAEIQDKPKLIAPHPLSQTVEVGRTVSFQCFIESVLEPSVKWLKQLVKKEDLERSDIHQFEYEGKKFMVLQDVGELLKRSDGSFLNKLVIQKVQADDAGMFICWAANKKGFSVRHAYLDIKPSISGADSSGRFSSSDLNPSIMEKFKPGREQEVEQEEEEEEEEANLPLLIGLPACVILVIILLVVFLMQRYNQCQHSSRRSRAPPKPPVPSHEREAYYYSNCHPHQHTINPLLTSGEKFPKTPTPSVDMAYSEFSSASRSHPNPYYYHHNHIGNGY